MYGECSQCITGSRGAAEPGDTSIVFLETLSDNSMMPRNTNQLEARLARVEKELAQLKAAIAERPPQRWYREIVGVFADDPAFAEITRLGRLIRQEKIKG